MSRRWHVALAAGAAGLILGATLWGWSLLTSPVEYVPVVMDNRQNLVVSPAMATPDHLDRVERVLSYYGEQHARVSPTKLLISRRLNSDRDLLWNYTTKAKDAAGRDRLPAKP